MKTLLSLVLLTLAATVQAYGVDDNLGTVTNGTNDAFTLENSPPGFFTDTVDFDLESSNAVVSEVLAPLFAKQVSVALYNDTTSSYVFQCLAHCTPSDDSFTNLASGNEYSLIISGKGTGDPTGTSYVLGNLSVTGAVPEANTVTMMIAGLGFLALCGWRRRAY